MKKAQLIHICGDFHGEWDALNVFINQKIRQSKKWMDTILLTETDGGNHDELA